MNGKRRTTIESQPYLKHIFPPCNDTARAGSAQTLLVLHSLEQTDVNTRDLRE